MLFEKLKSNFPGLKANEPLKNHSTFRVGGPADYFYELSHIEELPTLITLSEENNIAHRVIGRGTNVIFTDKGFRGLIIKNISNKMESGDTNIVADSGVLLAQIIRFSITRNLTGLEPLYGLPGSIGGAVWGNAGIPGTETGQFVKSVTLFSVSDGIREVPGKNIIFRYRETSLQKSGDVILRVELHLQRGNSETSKKRMQEIDSVRRGKQPTGYTAGSFFKNPSTEKTAGMLIDQTGLKGERIGGAEISGKHANFFMNTGNATAEQILVLADLAKKRVKEKFGIDLEMEVKIIGER